MASLEHLYSRNELYWGKEAQEKLFKKHILIVGLGGVGSYAADALARSGIGRFTLVDFDKVAPSNINRQLIALSSTVGKAKTELMKERILDINPEIVINTINSFYTENLNYLLQENSPDFVIDAIDTLQYKIDLIKTCKDLGISVITSLGAGNRIDPTKLYLADISETKPRTCPFLKKALSKLKVAGITQDLPVVSSTEKPFNLVKTVSTCEIQVEDKKIDIKKFVPASTPFVPPVAGYMMASYVVRKFLSELNYDSKQPVIY
jgi:tRNA A37 threonylcarbamoyladenosine dehydratase